MLLHRALGGLAGPVAAALALCVIGLPLTFWLLKLAQQLDASLRKLNALDTRDTLTGVTSRPQFLALAEREWARARRYGGGAALVLVEVDRFQRLCEHRGAEAGDAVLRALAAHTSPTLRGADALGRFEGAQLAVWLANADSLGALDAAERIRERTEILEVPWRQQMLRVTVSVGVAVLRPAHVSLAALIEDGEAAVQAARQTGGNCVRAAPVDPTRVSKIGPSVGDNQPL
jgi:diguanylate cyclase (GGDEF)-like protein